MDIFVIATILIVLSAIFGFINIRFLKLPNTIGLMVVTILATLFTLLISLFDDTLLVKEKELIRQINFQSLLLDIMLSFMLFAGALHTNVAHLKEQAKPISMFATLSTVLSTFLIGTIVYGILYISGSPVDIIYCLLFGALISPTDPIAVLGILKKAQAPQKLETKIVGESLFNDGVGVVLFLTLFEIAKGEDGFHFTHVLQMFALEIFGGILLGAALGWISYRALKSIDDYSTEVILTIAAVMGGTVLAQHFHLSAPLAMVTAGLFIGHDLIQQESMSDHTQRYVEKFWELVDILLNTILFVMIGMELLVLPSEGQYLIIGFLTVPALLLSRYVSLLLPIRMFAKELNFVPNTTMLMTWGGLRGGISIALALSLDDNMHKDMFLVVTYIIVVFSIIVQGLTVGRVVQKLASTEPPQS